jgi:hypothetical protein
MIHRDPRPASKSGIFDKSAFDPCLRSYSIEKYDYPAKAFLVIDVQEDYTGLNRELPPNF